MSRDYPRTNDQIASVTLLLSLAANAAPGQHRLRVPFNAIDYDQRAGTDARFFALAAPRFNAPAGVSLLAVTPYANAETEDPRASVVAGVDLLLSVAQGIAAFDAAPLVLLGHGAANDCDVGALTLPTVTPTVGAPWTVSDADGAAVGIKWTAPSSGLDQRTITDDYAATGYEDRLDLDDAGGGTITLPLAVAGLHKEPRLTIENIGDAGTWTVALTSPNTFPGGATSVSLPPNNSLETYVAKRANGSYRWAKV